MTPIQADDTAHPTDVEDASQAAADLVAAFGRHETAAYFAHFAPDATFIFYNVPQPLPSRAAYEALWSQWEHEDGFRVRSCTSSNRQTRVFGDVAVFTHDVLTVTETHGGTAEVAERETIVFRRYGTDWLAVHEHLSPQPAP